MGLSASNYACQNPPLRHLLRPGNLKFGPNLSTFEKVFEKGVQVIIAGAGGAAHLPGMMASHTQLPVIGVPIESTSLNGIDSLLSIVQMPKGVPVATVSIGKTGAKNAAILAAEILSLQDEQIRKKLSSWKISMTKNIPYKPE